MFIHTYTFQDMHITKAERLDTLLTIESLKYDTRIWLSSPYAWCFPTEVHILHGSVFT
jgi:hypothetical protein